jgi:hypothetical protein
MTQLKLSTIVALLVVVSSVSCWHSTGHLTVSHIASLHLQESAFGQKVLDWSNKILQPYAKVCGEDKWPFTECATWPDKVKAQGYWMMANWHFTDVRYYKPGYTPPAGKVTPQIQNIVWAINNCSGNLISNNVDHEGKSDSGLMKSISLRNLIHFVGDIHQPLHTTGRFSAELPDGDMGGNLFPIKHYSTASWNNLHFIWDHLMDMGREVQSPLSQTDYNWLNEWSQNLMDLNPYDKLKDQMKLHWDAQSWDDEGYEYVSKFVYNGIKENEDLPQDYQDEAKRIIKKRLALGGYRLADQLMYIYNKHQEGGNTEEE